MIIDDMAGHGKQWQKKHCHAFILRTVFIIRMNCDSICKMCDDVKSKIKTTHTTNSLHLKWNIYTFLTTIK